MTPLGEVRQISAAEVIPLRWTILRAGLERAAAIFPGDDAPETCHLGLFLDQDVVGVVSLYPRVLPELPVAGPAWQLRGMAIQPPYHRQGHGHKLITACLEHLRQAGASTLWCNARVSALGFYLREGFTTLGSEFEIPTAGPHYRMWRLVTA